MKIYTKTGDAGETSLFGGNRVRKDDPRVEASGAIDELNAALGVARAQLARLAEAPAARSADGSADAGGVPALDRLLEEVQHHLFDLGAELATVDPKSRGTDLLEEPHVRSLEDAIDRYESGLPPLREFVLPGGSATAAQLHLARCVCRRAERRIVALALQTPIRELPVRYVNRLGDLLFVLAREGNRLAGASDVPWVKPSRGASA